MYRNTYAEIDKDVLRDNIKNIVSTYSNYEYFFGVVKGNAYGHGFEIINSLIEGGVNYLAVATPEEALTVRKKNADIKILCLENVNIKSAKALADKNVTLTVCSLHQAEELTKLTNNFTVHLKLDTGMNRLGFKEKEELNTAYKLLKSAENVTVEGIYTHLATSGVNDKFYDNQIEKFKELTSDINFKEIPIVHIGRSLILVHHDKPDFVNGIRLGICMYGFAQSLNEPTGLKKIKREVLLKTKHISPSVLKNSLDLKTAFTLKSEVIALKKVKKGEFVGYGAGYIAKRDITVATVCIGYFDGIPSTLKKVFINGKVCEVIGEKCMDMISAVVPENTKVGDSVEIFGDNISVKSAAASSGVSAYKLLTGVSERVPRVYK